MAAGAAAASVGSLTACVSPQVATYGHASSYATQVLKPGKRNTVFHWVDVALQQVRDQRVLVPRAAYNYGLAMSAGFLAANGIVPSL